MAENKTIDNIITRLKESGRYDYIVVDFKNKTGHEGILYSTGTISIIAHRGNKNKGYILIFQYAENNMKEKRHAVRPLYRRNQIFRDLNNNLIKYTIHKFLVYPDESNKGYNVLLVRN